MNTEEKTYKKDWFKFSIGLFVCLVVRLIPFRAPNVEPILTASMPFSKAYGAIAGFFFGVLSILMYDLMTSTIGTWTILTSLSYGFIGVASHYYFKNRQGTRSQFVGFAVLATLFFDATTGLLTGPIFFDQPFMVALVGQIPFTALHLAGNITFAALLSPWIYHFLVRKRVEQPVKFINNLHPKAI